MHTPYRSLSRLSLLLIALYQTALSHSAPSWDVPIPTGMNAVWVGDDLRQNGWPVQIQRFTYADSVQNLLTFYRQQWQSPNTDGQAPSFIENTVGDWHIISQLKDQRNTVVQIRQNDNGQTEGFISVANIGDYQESPHAKHFPKMSGSEWISATESSDLNKEAMTLILQNRFSVEANVRFYHSRMPNQGWRLQKKLDHDGVGILLFHKKNAQLEMAIHRNEAGLTTIVANVVTI